MQKKLFLYQKVKSFNKNFYFILGMTKVTKELLTLFNRVMVQQYLHLEIHFWTFLTLLVPLNIKKVTSCANAVMTRMERKVIIISLKTKLYFISKEVFCSKIIFNLCFSAFWKERMENVLLYIKRTCIIFAQR